MKGNMYMFKKGFTLAEVLITMTIIGIVAAVTIPSLMSSTSQKAFDNQAKALHSRMANALTGMGKLDGYGTRGTDAAGFTTYSLTSDKFIVDGLSKVYKIKDVCNSENMSVCGIQDTYLTIDGLNSFDVKLLFGFYHTGYGRTDYIERFKPAAFTTTNGESILLKYNRGCTGKKTLTTTPDSLENSMCVTMLYDLNGPKAPNQFGKDVGVIVAFYNEEPVVVAPVADEKSLLSGTFPAYSSSSGATTASKACNDLGGDYRLPDIEELSALFTLSTSATVSPYGVGNTSYSGTYYWSSTTTSIDDAGGYAAVATPRQYENSSMQVKLDSKSNEHNVICIKK